jgi:Fe-S cluster assembly protein SufD
VSDLAGARDHWVGLAEARGGGGEPGWLEQLRAGALADFAGRGLPTTREEEWRYTDVGPIARVPFAPAEAGHAPISRLDVESLSFPVYACSLYVFVNGFLERGLSVPEELSAGVRMRSLAAHGSDAGAVLGTLADCKQHPFTALNTALFDDGALLEIPAGAQAEQTIHLVFVSTGTDGSASSPRIAIRAGAGSRARVIQDHVSLGPGRRFTNAVTEVAVGEDASLDLTLLQREAADALHVSNLSGRLERDARLRVHTLALGGALVRNDLSLLLAGPGADCTLHGLFVGTGDQVVDNHTLVDHAVPHGTSRELYKGVLAGRSRGVFRGRVIVRPGADKTDATQSNPNLLIGQHAEIATKPQLEIHADDVRCRHGATAGRIDPEALFYLRARGIGEAAARDLLTRGFAHEVLRSLGDPALEECVAELLLARLAGAESS